jgi:hypothetical protein
MGALSNLEHLCPLVLISKREMIHTAIESQNILYISLPENVVQPWVRFTLDKVALEKTFIAVNRV